MLGVQEDDNSNHVYNSNADYNTYLHTFLLLNWMQLIFYSYLFKASVQIQWIIIALQIITAAVCFMANLAVIGWRCCWWWWCWCLLSNYSQQLIIIRCMHTVSLQFIYMITITISIVIKIKCSGTCMLKAFLVITHIWV